MASPDEVFLRSHRLSLLLLGESHCLLDLYAELQGFSAPPPPLRAPSLPAVAEGPDWRQRRGECLRFGGHFRRLASEQNELNETGSGLHAALQLAVTGLDGLHVNLGHVLDSLGLADEAEEEEEEEVEEGDKMASDQQDGRSAGGVWESKVEGYHLIVHWARWLGNLAVELEGLGGGPKPEA